jgi:TolA-binding protein
MGLYNDGMYDLAIDQFHNFINSYQSTPQAVEARFYLGLAQLNLKKYDEARETFQNFALSYSDNPKAPEAWINVGKTFEASGNYHEAGSAYERVKTFHPKSSLVPDALFMAGTVYVRNGELESAKNCFKAILRDYSSAKSANKAGLALGEVYAREGNYSPALKEIEQSLENALLPEEKIHTLLALGRLQLQQALFTAAESTFTTILLGTLRNDDFTAARFDLGTLLLRKHQYPNAISQLKIFLETTSTSDTLRLEGSFALGKAYLQTHAYKNAVAAFENILREKEDTSLAEQSMLGIIQASIGDGDPKTARATLQKYLFLFGSQNPISIVRAAIDAKNLGQYSLAAQLYTSYIERSPSDPSTANIMSELARIYSRFLNNPQQADLLLNRIIEKFPNTPAAPAALRQIAENALLRSDYQHAVQTYRDLLSGYPGIEYTDTIRTYISTIINQRATSADSAIRTAISIVGGLADSVPKSELFYKLGLLYENGLKEYIHAKYYFLKSLANGLTGNEKTDATVQIARCLQRESERDSSLVPQAISACENFLREFPSSQWTEEIILAKYSLESSSAYPHQKIDIAKNYLARYPSSFHRPRFSYDLASASLTIGDTATAASTLSSLISDSTPVQLLAPVLIDLGRIMLHRQNPDSAADLFQRAIDLSPVTPVTVEAIWEMANLDWKRNAFSPALQLWKRLSDEFGYSRRGWSARERVPDGYLATGEYAEATRGYRALIHEEQNDPSPGQADPDLLSRLADVYEKQGNYLEAGDVYRGYLRENPDGALAANFYLALGNISKIQGDRSLAVAYFHEASALGTNGAPSRDNADLLFENGQYRDAQRYYLTLAQGTDTTAKLYCRTRAIVSAFRQDDLTEGIRLSKLFQESLAENLPSIAEIEYEHGLALYRKQQYGEARQCFERVKNNFEKTRFGPWGWFYLGKISEVLNKLEDAAGTYDDILKKFPSSDVIPRVLLSLGNMHFNAERYEQAIAYYQKIIGDSSRAGDALAYALNNIIEADESLKLYDAALAATRQFIRCYPNDENIFDKKIKIGTLYTRIGYYDQAVQQFESILTEAGNDVEPELFYDIGEAYYYKGDYQQAILDFLKVPYTTGKSGKVNWTATALYMAGQSYEKLTKFEEAITMYQQIIDRPGIDATFKASARKEISRVRALINKE